MKQPIYVFRPLLNASRLAQYAEAVGLRNVLLPVDMHVTVAYSRDPVDWAHPAFIPDGTTILAIGGERHIRRFGESVVLEFQCRAVSQRWASMIMAGASWDHQDFRPHVTLAIDPQASIEGIIAPSTDLRFGPERREMLDHGWEPKVKAG